MAFSAARTPPMVIFNLNERTIGSRSGPVQLGTAARTVSLMSPAVHALVLRQLSGKKLQVQSMPSRTCQRSFLVPRASNGHGNIRRSQPGDAVPGDPKLQAELVDVLRIEIAKAQMSMFCDEEADKLREIAAEGLRELDRKFQNTIMNTCNEVDAEGERALKRLDADAARFRMRIEESKAQAEASARDSELLQQSISEALNERLFFKNLYTPAKPKSPPRTAVQAQQVQQELQAIRDVTADSFGSSHRRLLYGALSIVMTSALWSTGTAFMSGNPIRWSKVVIYLAILGCIFMQLWFESSQTSSGTAIDSDPQAEALKSEDKK